MANILLITQGSGGDVKPFIKIGMLLKKMGNDVSLITHCIYEQEVKMNNLNFIAIDNYSDFKEKNDRLNNLADPIKELDKYIEFNRKFCGSNSLYKEYKIISKYCDKKDTIIIFRHRFSIAGLLTAEKFKIPVASVFLAPNYIQHLELHEQLIGSAMKDEINKVRNKIGLENIQGWTKWMCSPKLKIATWPEWYAKDEVNSIENMVTIGFPSNGDEYIKDIPKEVKEFLKDKKETALLTAGTSNMINHNFYKLAIKSCENADINAIVVTPFDELLPDKLPSNILRLKEAPISKIMPYISVVIHHGGIGTSSEALATGTPQLILAHLVDRPDNADRLKKLGVALEFPEINWKPDLIGQALVNICYHHVLSERCKILSDEIKNEKSEDKLNSIIEDMSNNNSKYIVKNSSEEYEDAVVRNKKADLNNTKTKSISEEKKRILVNLLRERRMKK